MKSCQVGFIALLMFLLTADIHASIINVPGDENEIQDGIHAADDGDTVLVQPGIYIENIGFCGKEITVASLFLTTGIASYIDSTIIDGDSSGSVVTFDSGESEEARLVGFTIQNGHSNCGGGILIESGSSPRLSNLIVKENYAGSRGGGICVYEDCSPVIQDILVINNRSGCYGGGITFYRAGNPILEDSEVKGNGAQQGGAGIWIFGDSDTIMDHVIIARNHNDLPPGPNGLLLEYPGNIEINNLTLVDNTGQGRAIGYSYHNDDEVLVLNNCILWNPDYEEISVYGAENICFNFCNIRNGQDIFEEMEMEWEPGMLDEDPGFVDPDNGDYNLLMDSPCIDAGDPEGERDPDGSRNDMGALPFRSTWGAGGVIVDLETGEPIPGVCILNSLGFPALIDDNGNWSLISSLFDFDLIASAPGYLDSVITDLHVEIDETLNVDFRLRYSELACETERMEIETDTFTIGHEAIRISNTGNGAVEWTGEVNLEEQCDIEPWKLRRSKSLSGILGVNRLRGVASTGDRYIIVTDGPAQNPELPDMIWQLDRYFNVINSAEQPFINSDGLRDIAWDGELLWGSNGRNIYGMDTEGEIRTEFEGPYNPNYAVAWDNNRNLLWVGTARQDIVGMNRDGEGVFVIENPGNIRIYGLACLDNDVLILERADDYGIVYLANPDNNEIVLQDTIRSPGNLQIVCAEIMYNYDRRAPVLITVGSAEFLQVWQVEQLESWVLLDPSAGTIDPHSMQNIDVTFDATWLYPDEYTGQIIFNHNGRGEPVIVDLDVTVTLDAPQDERQTPVEFGISGVYPNPFNSSLNIAFNLNRPSAVEINIYNVRGQLISSQPYIPREAGENTIHWDASQTCSGIYIIRIDTDTGSYVRKAALVR